MEKIEKIANYVAACPEEFWWIPVGERINYLSFMADRITKNGGQLIEAENSIACIESLSFDSKIFRMGMGRITWFWSLPEKMGLFLSRLKANILEKGWQHLTVRLSGSRIHEIQVLEDAGFKLVDIQATLVRQYGAGEVSPSYQRGNEKIVIAPLGRTDVSELEGLSQSAFVLSRLLKDPKLQRSKANELHDQWFKNNIEGRAALNLVAKVEGTPVGFISCLLHKANDSFSIPTHVAIDLIAVDEKYRGMSVGKTLVNETIEWFRGKADFIKVETQGYNYPALSLYMGAGFKLKLMETTFHILLE